MEKKKTEELMNELCYEDNDLGNYFENNSQSMIEVNLHDFWCGLIEKSGLTKSDIINKSDFGYVYFYDVINGRKIPSHDKIVRLILASGLTLEDCQTALKFCGRAQLYPRIKRDSIMIYAIAKKMSVYELSELLIQQGEQELK